MFLEWFLPSRCFMGYLCLLILTAILTMPIRAHLPDKKQEVNRVSTLREGPRSKPRPMEFRDCFYQLLIWGIAL